MKGDFVTGDLRKDAKLLKKLLFMLEIIIDYPHDKQMLYLEDVKRKYEETSELIKVTSR